MSDDAIRRANSSTPGIILPGGIVLIDEPAHCNVTTFAVTGDVLLTLNTRPGGNCGQVIVGLSANQALQLIDRLQQHADACGRAVAEGRGGARFPDRAKA
jgi:hypothetical protein